MEMCRCCLSRFIFLSVKPSECFCPTLLFRLSFIEGFLENPNTDCPVGGHIHLILDDKLERVQSAMEKKMAAITVADVIGDTEKYAGQKELG
ncbi:hypothetical protein [Pseudoramibacter alactolyticus]|uniref:hypothetical protein n=1 Tax=Pseudoramibacter alactolyticus TaxID=113287 RepID=UPI00248DD820|nr:hypothetical protein [Pseudoramibacter alactolyticus]